MKGDQEFKGIKNIYQFHDYREGEGRGGYFQGRKIGLGASSLPTPFPHLSNPSFPESFLPFPHLEIICCFFKIYSTSYFCFSFSAY